VEGYYLRAYIRWRQSRPDESLALLGEALAQSTRKPILAGVPAEGDVDPDRVLPPTTVKEKLLIPAFWEELAERYPEGKAGPEQLAAEFNRVDAHLADLRTRPGKGPGK